LLQQRDQYKELMINAYGAGEAPATPTKAKAPANASTPKSALSAVTGVFSARKERHTVAQLTAENEELKKLERLRPQLMDLQQKLAAAQQEAEAAAQQREEDSSSLVEENRDLAAALQQAQKLGEKSSEERDAGLALASEWSARAETAEREVRRQSEELDDIKEQMADMVGQSIDPMVVDQLNDKIVELES
jgi:exonuclease VII large subunit